MEPVRFVHAADLHLAAPFKGVDADDPRVREALVNATYSALDAVVAVCVESRADFLVLAGDLYDSTDVPLRAETAFRDACVRLADAGVRVFVAHGNHDPLARRTFGRELPPEVHVFSSKEVERVVFERDGVAVCALYGRSYHTAAETQNLALGYVRDPSDSLAIGVLHANVGGRPEHEPYAPCSLEDLKRARMDYWALGHIHKPEVLSEDPAVVYAGSTQGLQPNETGPRGCQLVTLSERGATVEFVPTAAVLWDAATVDCSEAATIDEVRAAIDAALDEVASRAAGTPAIARLTLAGRTHAHAMLARPGALADLEHEVRAGAMEREPWVWVGRLKDLTRPVLDVDALRESEDLAGDVVRLADALASEPDSLEQLLSELVEPVAAALEGSGAPLPEPLALLERARDVVLDRLVAGDAE